MPKHPRKQSLYFHEQMLLEIQNESIRLSKPLSWIVRKAWLIAKPEIERIEPADVANDDGGEE